jgi:alkylation response protein AidB-like acyl-CoA dehydrogenase
MQGRDDRSLGELFAELSEEMRTLVRQEMNLAKAEMTQKASRVGKDLGFLGAGGAVAYAGLLAIVAGIIFVLAEIGLALWLSALLVGIVVAAVGYFLVRKGLDALKREDPVPRQTMETLKEDKEWAKDQTDRTR